MFLYAASYLLLLNPIFCVTEGHLGLGNGYHEADYRFGGEASQIIFAPIHSLDRMIRPDYWNRYSTPLNEAVQSIDEIIQGPQKSPFD